MSTFELESLPTRLRRAPVPVAENDCALGEQIGRVIASEFVE
jgi:hypothetical protein